MESNKNTEYQLYLDSLQGCSNIAKKEHIRLEKNIKRVKRTLGGFNRETKLFIEEIKGLESLDDNQLISALDILNNSIIEKLEVGINAIDNSAKKKKEALENFTVTLFGRTKAGKSTLREALTAGNGESIGKGGQRTTREIYRYNWNKLKIIDTPGIAAYEGEDDVKIAQEVIDESDLILFLVTSDSIQEAEFEQLVNLRSQNKPVIIILNVKQAIDKNIQMKRFLRDYKNIISEEGQKGNILRIREYCDKYLGNRNIDIIPIHARAAYESNKAESEDMKLELYKASKVNTLKFKLRNIITNYGRQKRVLTFRDDYIGYLNSLEGILWESYREIRSRKKYIEKKHFEVQEWFKEYKEESEFEIEREVTKIYDGLISDVDDFIDRYAGNDNIESLWKKKMENHKVDEKVNSIYKNLITKAERYLNEFQRQMNFETNNINFNQGFDDIKDAKKGVMGKVLRWSSAALDGLFLISITNFWNLAGWVTATLGIIGVGISVLAWLFGSDVERYDNKKRDAKNSLVVNLKKMKNKTIKQLKKHVEKNIINNLHQEININLEKNKMHLEEYLEKLKMKALEIREAEDQENRELFRDIYELTFKEKIKSSFLKVVRYQGLRSKIMLMEDVRLKLNKNRRILENIIGEKIIYVEFTNNLNELVKRSLYPGSDESLEVEIKDKTIILNVEKKNMGKIIGKNGINIKLTNRLLDTFNIELREQ